VKVHLCGKLKREPTNKEVIKEAKATIPEKETLKRRVEAIVQYVCFSDLTATMPVAANAVEAKQTGPITSNHGKKRRFFRVMTDEVCRLVDNQMKHVIKGCLLDPPKEVVKIHQVNPVTGKAFSGRSTGTNENDNMFLNRLLNTPSIGLSRAERVISDHYEASNEKKQVSRLGGDEQLTTHTEKAYAINSIAKSCGFSYNQLPIKECVSVPRTLGKIKELVGWLISSGG
jgi:hypothetical protein